MLDALLIVPNMTPYKDQYLKDGLHCPFCGGSDIVAPTTTYYGEGDWQSKPPKISIAMECENCGKKWFDVYQLVDIENLISGEDKNVSVEPQG